MRAPIVAILLVAVLALPAGLAMPTSAEPSIPQEGHAPPPVTAPAAVVVAFSNETWHNQGDARTHAITVPTSPTGSWDRIVLQYREMPSHDAAHQDPWDRLCSAAIQNVEVLRCTTPRTDFTLTRDITAYASLLPQGATVNVTAITGSYDQPSHYRGGQNVTVKLFFYVNEPTAALVAKPHQAVVPAFYHHIICATSTPYTVNVTFPANASSQATAEITLSGHGNEEDWFLNDPAPNFHLSVDGQEVAQVVPMPYTYAFVGSYGSDYSLHPLMWWTAQHATNEAGIYTGVGRIPPYEVALSSTVAASLTGVHQVSLVGEDGGCYWPASVSFLLN